MATKRLGRRLILYFHKIFATQFWRFGYYVVYSTMKRATASANAATSPKRTKSDRSLPACLIKTEELFQDNFGETFSIEKKGLVLTEWNNEMGRAKIKAWLVSLGPYFAGLLDKIKRNSEASIYTLIINALVPVMELSTCLIVEASQQPDTALTEDEVEEISIRIAQGSRENSLTELNSSSEDNNTSGMLDTTNATDVRKFIIYVEEVIRSCEFPKQGQAELIIHDTTKPKNVDKVAVVEAKRSVTPDDREGFFQTCAYMALTRVKYGIHTSHKAWEFIRLEEKADGSVDTAKHSISHSKIYDLMKSNYKEFDEQAVDVYAYLLEIFGVPASTDLVASYAATVTATAARGDLLVARLK